MPTPEGLPSLEEVFGRAAVETGFEEPSENDLFEAGPPAERTPDPEAGEQTQQDQAQPEEQADESLFSDLLKAEPEEGPQGIDWAQTVELDGVGPVPLSELRDGYLRQADYTRKTQTLAEERKAFAEENEQASKLYRALIEDPAGTAAYLAVQTGVVEEGQVAGKVRSLQSIYKPPPQPEQVEAEIEKRVAAQVAQHPAVLQAQQQALLSQIDRDFARIEQKHQIKLTDKDKEAILERAIRSQTPDLELVTESMLRRLEKVRQDREAAREAATPRPGVRGEDADAPAKIKTLEDAFALALQEAQAGG